MASSLPLSSQTDGGLEPPDFTDSRFPSRHDSYHESDVPSFSHQDYIWPWPPLDTFSVPHVQSFESIQTALSVPSAISSITSPIRYYPHFQSPLLGDNGDPVVPCPQASSWQAYTSDYATVDVCHGHHAGIQRTDSTSSLEMAKKTARASFPVYPSSRGPWKAESDRASRCRSIVGMVTPPADAGVRKTRKAQLQTSSFRRNSFPLSSSGANVKPPPDTNWRMHSPTKDEVMYNDDPLSSEDEDSRHMRNNAEKELTLACPFYRRWPTRHIACMSRKLTRIQDVKQHIYRRHSQSPFYCPTCSEQFSSPDPRDEHIREASCTPAIAPSKCSTDGISPQVRNSLKHRFTRRRNPIEQWYGIWDLIFPTEKPPESPHFGGMVSEMLGILRHLCKHESQRFIPSVVNPSPTEPITQDDLQVLMIQMLDKVQDHLEGEPQQTGGDASDGLISWTTQMMESSPINGEAGASAEDEEIGNEQTSAGGIWDAFYSPFGSPATDITGAPVVEPCASFNQSGLLDEPLFTEQTWMAPTAANPLVKRFQ